MARDIRNDITKTAKDKMQYLINLEKEKQERVKRADDAKAREDASKKDFRQNMAPKIIGSLFGNDNSQQAKDVETPITPAAPTYSNPTPQVKQENAPMPAVEVATPKARARAINTPTTSTPQETQSEVIKTPKEGNVLSPEQKAQEQNRMKQEADAMTANKAMSQASLDYGQMAQILDDNVKKSREKDALTEEQIRKRKRLFNAIGDGLGALTNLYFTTQGAPSVEYDPRGSLTARQQERWDAIDANRNALAQQEYQRKQNELAMRLAEQRQLRQEAIAARQRAEDKQWRQSEADRQYKQHQESLANQRAIQEMMMQNRLEEEKIAQSGMNYRANVSADTQKQKAAASTAKAMRGKPLQFSDGKNTVSIYENVWKPSMQQVYDAMLADGVEDASLKVGPTAAQIENFVKQNWQKSPKAKELMKVLSNIDPAVEYNHIAEDEEEVIEYSPEDEVIEYVPKKK